MKRCWLVLITCVLSHCLACCSGTSEALEFEKVVIWGHKLHSHTHSYIHEAFFRAFKHLGYDTYWFDSSDDVINFDFSKALFITEGQVDKNIPVREDCLYVLHNCYDSKYKSLHDQGRCIKIQVYIDKVRTLSDVVKIAPCIYADFKGQTLYMPWATNLLPHEIDAVKLAVPKIERKNKVYWVGTKGGGTFGNEEQLVPFAKACKAARIGFIHIDPWARPVSLEENIALIQRSFIAPAIVGQWQLEQGYIPCRIFKNISYGQMGVTNSERVSELFGGKIVYNSNTYQLFFDAEQRIRTLKLEELYALMDFVKEEHTYINRIQTILEFFKQVTFRVCH